jgi:hypothetical protein
MKKYMTYAVATFVATIAVAAAAPDKEAIITKEKAAWQAFKDKKADDFKKVVSADMMAVYDQGIYNMAKEMDAMAKMDMKSFSLSEFNVSFPDPETAIITYKAKVDGTSEGHDASGSYNAGSVWRMKSGEWRAIFHTDMKEAPAAK